MSSRINERVEVVQAADTSTLIQTPFTFQGEQEICYVDLNTRRGRGQS
jgi:hypothetical protein